MEAQNSAIINNFYYVGREKINATIVYKSLSPRWSQHTMITSRQLLYSKNWRPWLNQSVTINNNNGLAVICKNARLLSIGPIMEAQNSAIINNFYYVGERKDKRNHCLQVSISKMVAAHNDYFTSTTL